MITLFGKEYYCDREALKNAILRIVNGAELTICYKEKEAWINKYHHRPQKVDFDIAYSWLLYGIVGPDSGNEDTGEEHYTYKMR